MNGGWKLLFLCLIGFSLSLTSAAGQLDVSSDRDTINADGDLLEFEAESKEKNITNIRIYLNGDEVEDIAKIESLDQNSRIKFTYDNKLTGGENLSAQYTFEGKEKILNIKKNLTRYDGEFKGFYDEEGTEITRQLYYRELDKVRISLNMSQTDGDKIWQPEGLLGEDFEIVSLEDNTSAELSLEGTSRNPYSFSFASIPNMEVGEKDFVLRMKNGPDLKEFTIQKRAAFEGKVLTKSGPGNGEFKLVDESISNFATDEDGYFFKLLESGSVDRKMELDLGEVTTTFSDIEVKSGGMEDIKYEFYKGLDPDAVQTDELLKPLNLIAFSSNYPIDIDETSVTMNYNTSNVNPSEIEVYECPYWDFFGERCRKDWNKKEDEDVDNQDLLGKVTVTDLKTEEDGDFGLKSAYMVAVPFERPSLELEEEISLDKKEYNIEDSIVVEGNIIDSKTGKPVKDAEVSLSIQKNTNESVKSAYNGEEVKKTDEKGFFTFPPLAIPDKPGEYSLKLNAEKDSYNNISNTYKDDIQVSQRKDIELSGSEKDMKPGERTTSVLTIENTGQAPIDNIQVREENVKNDYYTLNPQTISSLGAGSSKTVTLMSILPDDYCNDGCIKDSFKISIEGNASGKTLSKEVSLTISEKAADVKDAEKENKTEPTTKKESNNNNSEKQDEEKNSSNSEPLITGDFMKGDTGLTLGLLGLLIVLLSLLVMIRRKNRNKGSNKNSSSNSNKIKNTFSRVKSQAKSLSPDLMNSSDEKANQQTGDKTVQAQKGTVPGQGRMRNISKPKVSASNDLDLEDKSGQEDENETKKNQKEKKADEILEESEDMTCSECGDEFDTETAFKLHLNHHH